jgi:8-oxo-dGTP pyrophosphatase MutT (NUDIX family)
MLTPTLKQKVFAYITHGRRLLVFSHPHSPAAGIQVPAGTIEPGEPPELAALREAAEETGLPDLTMAFFLGEHLRDMSDFGLDQLHQRYFYHLPYAGDPPATWRHGELTPSDGTPGPIVFEFFWAALPDGVPELIADHGKFLPELLERIAT